MRTLLIAAGMLIGATAVAVSGWFFAPEVYGIDRMPPVMPVGAPAFESLSIVEGAFKQQGIDSVRFNGDAAWSLLVRPNEAEARRYLQERKSQGFNAVLVNLIEHEVGGPRNARGELPFHRLHGFARPNESYFSHADRVFATAAELGIVVFLAPAYIGYECGNEGWCAELKSESADVLFNYGRYLGTRYRHFNNIVWVHGGDADARRFGLEGKVAAVAAGLRAAGGTQLHTAHCARNFSGGECYPFLPLDFDTVYASCATTAQKMAEFHELRRGRQPKPFIYIEGTYENMGETPHCMRDQLLLALLGGASGHIFGNQPVWDFAVGWQEALPSEGARTVTTLWTMLGRLSQKLKAEAVVSNSLTAARDPELAITVIYARAAAHIEPPLVIEVRQPFVCWIDLRQRTPAFNQEWIADCKAASSLKNLTAPHESDWLVAIATATQHPLLKLN